MASKMTKLGMKRKDLHGNCAVPCSPCEGKSEKDYENEIVYPELDASGPLAEQLGAEEVKVGEEFEQTVRWRVKRVRISEENGKKDFGLTLCMIEASDIKPEAKADDDEGEGDSPAMAYIQGRAKEA